MDLYVTTYGTYLHKKDDMFELKVDDKKTRISPKKVKTIVISNHAFLTTDAIKLALENNIDVVLLDDVGNPFGRFWHSKFGSTAFIRRKQLEISDTEEGLKFVKEWQINKIESFKRHLNKLKYKREKKADFINEQITLMDDFKEKIVSVNGNMNDSRNILMGYEGNAGKIYYRTLSFLIPQEFYFEGRSSRPAKDEFNCMLNYAFGILYSRVEKACIIAGLDPFIGIMHTDNYNKKSLVFDLIENYRHYATRVVFKMFSRKIVKKSFFKDIKNGFTLVRDGKIALIQEITEFFNLKTLYNKRKISNIDIIQFDCHNFANRLIEKE